MRAAVLFGVLLLNVGVWQCWARAAEKESTQEEPRQVKVILRPSGDQTLTVGAYLFIAAATLVTLAAACTLLLLRLRRQSDRANQPRSSPRSKPFPPIPIGDRLERKAIAFCPKCKRRYTPDMSFCPHDAVPLQRTSASPRAMICPKCNQVYPSEMKYCTQDSQKLVVADDDLCADGLGAVSICPQCLREYQGSFKTCPKDQSPLMKLEGPTCVYEIDASHGHGRLSGKICPTCSVRYKTDATFCGKDGTTLVHIN